MSENYKSNTKFHNNLSSKSWTFHADGSRVALRVIQNWAENHDKGKRSNITFLPFSLRPAKSKVHTRCLLLLINIQEQNLKTETYRGYVISNTLFLSCFGSVCLAFGRGRMFRKFFILWGTSVADVPS